MTKEIMEATERLGTIIHDHLVIGRALYAPYIPKYAALRVTTSRAVKPINIFFSRSLAEREGFEPSRHISAPTPLAGERLQPLGHLSVKGLSRRRETKGSRGELQRRICAHAVVTRAFITCPPLNTLLTLDRSSLPEEGNSKNDWGRHYGAIATHLGYAC